MADYFKGLVDQFGRPIAKASLTSEQAGPTIRGVRQPYGGHPAAGLTPGRLANVLRASIEGSPERYLELAEDMEERDLHYAGVLSIRKRQVSGLEITVEAASEDAEDEKAAELIRDLIGRDEFQDELIDILDAIGKGYSASEIIWDTSEGQWMPQAIKWRDPRHFEFDDIAFDRLLLRGDAGNEELKPFGWIVHRAKAKSGLTIRGGLARSVAWSFLFKTFTIKDWAIFAEAYGQPLRVGKFDPGASETDKDTLLEAVSNIGTDFAAIIPTAMQIEFIKADITGSHELYEKRADWLDRQVSKLVLGATGTVDAPTGGGYASSKVHDGVRDDIEKADARQLSATLNRDLVRPTIDLNMGPRRKYPKVIIGRPDEVDLKALVDNVVKLVPLGLPVSVATMQDKIGLPAPGEEEVLLVAARQAPAPVQSDPTPRNQQPAEPFDPAKPGASADQQPFAMQPTDDAIETAVTELLAGDDWQPLVEPIVKGLAEEIAAATSIEEVKAILIRRAATISVGEFTDILAKLAFGARLAGELEEPLDGN
ncbi:DUF935 domain-containing protein [Devosia sp. J2-20]|uniref:DUF935 domain-containing protein n=1 Tax=Devosia sp. J2-20 TaxID=3026161 RepID=UPI00249A4491|nr:DUF935 domain-containing protein [Devosia sp. J2-20]WDR00739.1 DUF935 domain-containing protein [Devosia sp. J2-20]